MNNSTVNFTTPEASASFYFGLMDSLQMCVFSISFLVGLPTHSYVTWLIVTGTGGGFALEFFNLNLTFCEIGSSLSAMFCLLSYSISSIKILTYFLEGLGITGRPLFQCLMSVERYLAVVHPVTFLKYKPLRYRVICCTVAWIITLGSCLVCILTMGVFYIYAWFFLLQLLLFLSIQLFCLVAVLRALKQSGPGERGRERREENHMKRRAFHLILITTINMIMLYVPFIITGLFVILTQQNTGYIWFPAYLSYVLAGFVQPVLYLQRAGKICCHCSS